MGIEARGYERSMCDYPHLSGYLDLRSLNMEAFRRQNIDWIFLKNRMN